MQAVVMSKKAQKLLDANSGRFRCHPFVRSVVLFLFLLTAFVAGATERQMLPGHRPVAWLRLAPGDRVPSTNHLRLAIGLPLRNAEALTNLLRELYDPASNRYRQYLTPEQFTASFGPTEKDYQATIAFAQANGLTVTGIHPNRVLLNVDGSVGDIERAFRVKLRTYPHPTEVRTFFAPDSEPSVELGVAVLHISGLDNFTIPRPMNLQPMPAGESSLGTPRLGSGPNGAFMGRDFRAAYVPDTTLTGAGQSLGLFELDGYYASDIAAYKSQAELPDVPLENVLVDGFNGIPRGRGPGTGNEEVALDIEMAISMAPGLARVLVYEGSPTASGAGLNNILNRMATDNRARQLSCSWGFDIDANTQQIFQQYAAQGQSFFLAAGDNGAFAGPPQQPSDNPYITVVGGTVLTTSSSGAWASESVWNGSGGGISATYPLPDWQQGLDMSRNQGSTAMRNLPDVAMVGRNIWLLADRGGALAVNGTSISAPLWAGFTALVNEQAAANGQPSVGFVNPALYAIGKGASYLTSFRDITTGNNTNSDSPDRFFAVPGYDLCTGWGSPNGTNLINALLALPPDALLVTSPLGFTALGPAGGPFNVTALTYSLTNLGSAPLNWTLVNTSAWLTVTPANGSLTPGGPTATVPVMLNSAASNLLLGTYSATVSFLNQNSGAAQARQFSLLVGNAGFETGDFGNWTFNADSSVNFVNSIDRGQFRGGNTTIPGVADELFVHSGIYGAFLGQNTSLGFISQAVPTEPGQSYLVSFWLSNPTNGVPNEFRATWGSTVLFDQIDLDHFGWTNLQFSTTATDTSTVLEFAFRNDLNAFGLDDVQVQRVTTVAPAIALSGNLAFGQVDVGSTASATLTISNPGNATLTVSGIDYPPGFSGAWSGTIPPVSSQAVTVTFAPTAAVSYSGTLTVNSDSSAGDNTLSLSGTGTVISPPATVLLRAADLIQTYDGLPKVVAASTAPAGLSLTITYNGSPAPPTAAGSYSVTASVTDSSYVGSVIGTLVIAPAELTVTAANASRAYGGVNPAFSATVSGFVNGDTAAVVSGTPAFNTSATAGSPVGTYPITPSVGTLSATNYVFGSFSSGTLVITPVELTVTAANASRAFGGINPAFAATISGFVNGDTAAVVNGTPGFNTSATAGSPVGTYPIIPSAGTLSAANYAFGNFSNGTLAIAPALLTVAAADASRAYGADNPAFTATISGFVNGDTAAVVSGTPVFNTPATARSPVGTYPITPSAGTLSATNYALGSFSDGTLAITPAVLTVTAASTQRAYGATNPAFTATISGFVNDDTVAVVSGTASFDTPATAASPAGSYQIIPTVGTLIAANYSFANFVNGTLTIVPNETTILNFTLNAGIFSVSIQSSPGSIYVLQYKDVLTDLDWQEGPSVVGSGGTVILTDNTATVATRYYRVRVD
jgi:hypothetical protein